MTVDKKLVIIGAGPAGLSAATAAYDAGITDIVVVERDECAGGILNQCVHNGFGLHTFKQELTGPEYSARYIKFIEERKIEIELNTMVLSVSDNRVVTCVNAKKGLIKYKAGAVILATGCRERPRGGVNIAGSRPAGVYSAGTAQRLVNIEGERIGESVFILGSGDIGLIMARRMTFEGANVKGVAEIMPFSSGLNRNIAQCLDDFSIPLMLSNTVTEIRGKSRLEGVVVAQVDERKEPIKGSERFYPCDTLLLSVGLLPENEIAKSAGVSLSRTTGGATVSDNFMTEKEGVFECGNALHVHDLVDFVSSESAAAGRAAARYLNGEIASGDCVAVQTYGGARYTVPQRIERKGSGEITVRLRSDNVYKNVYLQIEADGEKVVCKKRLVVTPGEMESVTVDKTAADALRRAATVRVGFSKE